MSVFDPSPEVMAMTVRAEDGRALMGGTKAMRRAGERYLPKWESEPQENYKARLNSSFLFNGYRKTVNDITGRVFDKPVEAEAPSMAGWLENADMRGDDLSTFARRVFEDAVSGCGVSFILIDAPRRDGLVTQAEAQARNLRPYLIHLTVENLLGWRSETINNVQTLTQFRYVETISEPDPKDEFKEKEVQQARVFDLIEGRVFVRVFRRSDDGDVLVEEYATDMDAIPLVPFYANRTGFMTGEPLMQDLADINIAHWQSQSDQRTALHFYRVPMLVVKGSPSTEDITIAAGVSHVVTDPDGDVSWVDASKAVAAMDAGRQDLKDLEFQMETFGLQLTVARTQNQSATGEVLDAKKETSQLSMLADALQDALEMALAYMADIGAVAPPSEVVVNKNFGATAMTAQEVTALGAMVTAGIISEQTAREEMKRRGFVVNDRSEEDERDLIEANRGAALEGVAV